MLDFASVTGNGENEERRDCLQIAEESHCTLLAVADGKTLPDTATQVLTTMVEDFKQTTAVTTTTLPAIFEDAQQKLTAFQTETMLKGGCVAAVMLTNGELALWAHIGDCRIYHLQDNLLYDITPDHSSAYTRYEAGEIRYPKIRTDRNRHNLYRMMGLEQECTPKFSQTTMVKKNDSFLICTDGFWENIHERQIEKTLRRSKNAADWLSRMEKIVKKNRETGKYTRTLDDYSAIAIQI
ncbi:MAG: protein phosphatase 2C domain-containing protein [Clostridia bacterium]|nr:protein phosphatase 2C domain-containing protein [Clostridia bacterium]